jgi:hypothetical protein
MDRAFSPLVTIVYQPRPTLLPRSDLGWYGAGPLALKRGVLDKQKSGDVFQRPRFVFVCVTFD